jgi:hypothetical protein
MLSEAHASTVSIGAAEMISTKRMFDSTVWFTSTDNVARLFIVTDDTTYELNSFRAQSSVVLARLHALLTVLQ